MKSKYFRHEAKEYAQENLRGLWAATLTPFKNDLSVDEHGYRKNLDHWINGLGIDGLFVGGKMGEYNSMTVEERKLIFKASVEAATGKCGILTSCTDQNINTVVELAKYSQDIGAEYIIVHTPVFFFGTGTDEAIYEYYRCICDQIDIGVVLWNLPKDCGYMLEPAMCMRLAEIPNVVGVKYSVPREVYAQLTEMSRGKLVVSCSSEPDWYRNMKELGWQVYLCSTPPLLLQTKTDTRMRDYTRLAQSGQWDKSKTIRDSLDPVREAFLGCKPVGKHFSYQKYWQDLLGQIGGPVRRPLLQVTDMEKATIKKAFEKTGLE
jgi:4-hydroxy-tetrahydrodipicolinate synthase